MRTSELTGPASGIGGTYHSYNRLAERGWRLTQASIAATIDATPPVAGFERNNSPLYIDAVYDGHFNLSLLGKDLASAYQKLGGPTAFGPALTQADVDALAAAYSIPAIRLQPHPAPALADG